MNSALRVFLSVAVLVMSAETVYAGKSAIPPVNPADFTTGQNNIYMPQAIGTTYVYEAELPDEVERNEVFITSDTIEILGVTCTVVHDAAWVYVRELDAWFLTEDTFDWYAWDNYGNVWYFGEDTVAIIYDENWIPVGLSTEGSWKAGVDGAEAGIVMLADPFPGVSYRQEYYEDIAEDMGKVLRLNASVSLENRDFHGCLKTKEWTPLAPGEIEHKYYAPGIGLIFVEELKEKTVKVKLVDIY